MAGGARIMKKVKFSGERFVEVIDGEIGEVLQCCFSKNNMSTSCLSNCVACEIIPRKRNDSLRTAKCNRLNFVFAEIED